MVVQACGTGFRLWGSKDSSPGPKPNKGAMGCYRWAMTRGTVEKGARTASWQNLRQAVPTLKSVRGVVITCVTGSRASAMVELVRHMP